MTGKDRDQSYAERIESLKRSQHELERLLATVAERMWMDAHADPVETDEVNTSSTEENTSEN